MGLETGGGAGNQGVGLETGAGAGNRGWGWKPGGEAGNRGWGWKRVELETGVGVHIVWLFHPGMFCCADFELLHVDEFVDELLHSDRVCDIILPRLQVGSRGKAAKERGKK